MGEKGGYADEYAIHQLVRSNLASSLAAAFDIESIYDADLAAEADDYLLEIGLTREEVDALKASLGADIQ